MLTAPLRTGRLFLRAGDCVKQEVSDFFCRLGTPRASNQKKCFTPSDVGVIGCSRFRMNARDRKDHVPEGVGSMFKPSVQKVIL
jgi:hypothetical protein